MKSLRTLFAAVLMAASLIASQAHASLIGETIVASASSPSGPNPIPADWALDQQTATIVDPGTEFTSLEGDFARFDFAASSLTILFSSYTDNWSDWPTYTFSGFEVTILDFSLDEWSAIDSADFLQGYSHTAHSITLNFGYGQLSSENAYAVFRINHVPEPQSIVLVLAALGLMGLSIRRGRALPR